MSRVISTAYVVTPAKAGVHAEAMPPQEAWIPAFAGMTVVGTTY